MGLYHLLWDEVSSRVNELEGELHRRNVRWTRDDTEQVVEDLEKEGSVLVALRKRLEDMVHGEDLVDLSYEVDVEFTEEEEHLKEEILKHTAGLEENGVKVLVKEIVEEGTFLEYLEETIEDEIVARMDQKERTWE